MAISKDLFLAILSMDSYNRGYGAGIADGGEDDPDGLGREGSSIGNAVVIDDAEDVEGIAKAAGFYAIAYDTPYGTVISYRGTDFDPDPGMINDMLEGWPVGGGNYYELQSLMATDFLDAVQADNAPGSIILTGHFLGGGLAA